MKISVLVSFIIFFLGPMQSNQEVKYYGNYCGPIIIYLQPNGNYSLKYSSEANIGRLVCWGKYTRKTDRIIFKEIGHRLESDTMKIGDRIIPVKIPSDLDTTDGFNDFKAFELHILSDSSAQTTDFYCGPVNYHNEILITQFIQK